jgi:hypothetical protein
MSLFFRQQSRVAVATENRFRAVVWRFALWCTVCSHYFFRLVICGAMRDGLAFSTALTRA